MTRLRRALYALLAGVLLLVVGAALVVLSPFALVLGSAPHRPPPKRNDVTPKL